MQNDDPSYTLQFGEISKGWERLTQDIKKSNSLVWIFDGPHYLNWEIFINGINKMEDFIFIDFKNCRLENREIERKISKENYQKFLTYGFPCDLSIRDLFSEEKIEKLAQKINLLESGEGKHVIIYGAGSSLINPGSTKLCWIEIPFDGSESKNNKSIVVQKNLLNDPSIDFNLSFQYIDEPITRKHRTEIFEKIHYYIYLISEEIPLYILGSVLRGNIEVLSHQPFRVNPIYFEKIWGGQYLRTHRKTEKTFNNIAGSYEMVLTKNNVVFSFEDLIIEVPLDLLVTLKPSEILGPEVIDAYGNDIPFCIYLTDTINGSDLSCQVHPTKEFNKGTIGSDQLMEEMYYVVKTNDSSSINLGFVENCNLKEFKEKIEKSELLKTKIDLGNFVKNWNTKSGSVFYIPPGCIHNICANNLVVEIISSPNIITLRLYDYLREKKQGYFRKLDIHDAWKILDPKINEHYVRQKLKPEKKIFKKGKNFTESIYQFSLSTITNISEICLTEYSEFENNDSGFHILNLVEGEKVLIQWKNESHILKNLQTLIIPAVIDKYKIINQSDKESVILKVKPNI